MFERKIRILQTCQQRYFAYVHVIVDGVQTCLDAHNVVGKSIQVLAPTAVMVLWLQVRASAVRWGVDDAITAQKVIVHTSDALVPLRPRPASVLIRIIESRKKEIQT